MKKEHLPRDPNMKKLIIHKMVLLSLKKLAIVNPSVIRDATEWVNQAVAAVRSAAEPNPWKNADDETIAGEILKGIEARKKKA